MLSWLVLASISVIAFSVASLFQRLAMKREDSNPIVSGIIFQLLLALFSGIFAVLKGFVPPQKELFPYLLISAIGYASGTWAFFQAIKTIEASVMAITYGFGSIVTITAAFLFIKERLTLVQMLGSVLILLALVVINFERKKFTFRPGILLALLGAALYGIATVNDAFIIRSYDAISYGPVMSLLSGLVLILMFPRSAYLLYRSFLKINKALLIYSFLYSISGVSFYSAIGVGALASQMTIFMRASTVLTVILAYLLLGEKKQVTQKFIGAILTTIGVVLIK